MATKNGLEKKKSKDKMGSKTTLIDLKKQLLDSVTQCKPKIVKRLMDSKVDPNCVNELGETPLIITCQLKDEEARRKIASLLLKNNACVNSQDVSGNTALSNAVKAIDEHLVETLLENGADVSLAAADGNTILCCAAVSGSVGITKLILKEVQKQKLPVDHKNMHGLTPLLLAAQSGHIEVARILVRDGKASVTIRDLDNFMTAEQWMKHAGYHSPQDIAFLSPKSRHRKKTEIRSLFDSVMGLDSESSPDIHGIRKHRPSVHISKESTLSNTFSLPHISSSNNSTSPAQQDNSTRSMFELPLVDSFSPSMVSKMDSKFKTERLPTSRLSKQDIFTSSYLSKRKNIVEHNKRSKFYAKGSLEPLPMVDVHHPPPLKRMNSVLIEKSSEKSIIDNRSTKQTTKLPPLTK